MPDLDLDRLEALADAATPGPWVSSGDRGRHPADVLTERADGSDGEYIVICEHAGPDAEFIAGTGPDVTKELVRQLREARARLAQAWKRGHDAGHKEGLDVLRYGIARIADNPYRSGDE